MRINILNCAPRSMKAKLLKHLIKLVAEDYQVDVQDLTERLASGCDQLGEAFCESLRDQGWLIRWYSMPPGQGYRDQIDVISMGFVLDPGCDRLIAWRLSHA